MRYRYQNKEARKKKKERIFVAVLAIIIVFLCLGLLFKLIDPQGNSGKATNTENEELGVVEYKGKDYIPKNNIETYLFMGIDSTDKKTKIDEYGESTGQCDVLTLLVRDLSKGTYKVMSINRNTITAVNTLDVDNSLLGTTDMQIALAHASGDGMEGSCENTVEAVSSFLNGADIDGYAAVNMGGIGIINHMVGGVTVKVEDDFSNIDPSLKTGESCKLSDKQAEIFVRSRMGMKDDDTNENRMSRQSVYLEALKPELIKKVNESASFVNDLYEELDDYMVTNISLNKLSKLAMLIAKDKDAGEVKLEGDVGVDELEFATFEVDEDSLNEAIIELFYKEYK